MPARAFQLVSGGKDSVSQIFRLIRAFGDSGGLGINTGSPAVDYVGCFKGLPASCNISKRFKSGANLLIDVIY